VKVSTLARLDMQSLFRSALVGRWLSTCSLKLTPLASHPTTAESIMHRLRQSIYDAEAAFTAGWEGWQPGNAAHHCTWDNVECDQQRHVTTL
jgi:hypothetical protein